MGTLKKESNDNLIKIKDEIDLDINNIKMFLSSEVEGCAEAELDLTIKNFFKKNIDVMFVFDRSGSCAGTEIDMIRGFNSFIKHEKEKKNNDFITVSLFNQENKIVYDRASTNKISEFEYQVYGNTALYDSVCEGLMRLQENHDDTEVIVVIMTDGEDNSSYKYDVNMTKELISSLKNQGWHFIFLGAMDYAKKYASLLGIDKKYAEIYSPEAVYMNFKAIEKVVDDVHDRGKVSEDWAESVIDARYQIEGRKDSHVKRLGR